MLRIVTDGAADILPAWSREYGIDIIPVNILFGEKSYLQYIDLDNEGFYKLVDESKRIPKTSQPSPHQFLEFIQVETTPTRLKRGEYLANAVCVCMDCHSKRDWTKFSGPPVEGTLGQGGEVFNQDFGFPGSFISKNITPAGIKDWSDGEIFRTITTGVNKYGKALFPIMPYMHYGQMDQEDLYSIIAYIRSLQPIEKANEESKPDFPMNFILNTIPSKQEMTNLPSPAAKLAYGKYMWNASGCTECHTKQEKGKQVPGMEMAGGL